MGGFLFYSPRSLYSIKTIPIFVVHNKKLSTMTINLKIQADVSNIDLSGIYGLLQKVALEKQKDKKVYTYNGYFFRVETDIDMSVNYYITELT